MSGYTSTPNRNDSDPALFTVANPTDPPEPPDQGASRSCRVGSRSPRVQHEVVLLKATTSIMDRD